MSVSTPARPARPRWLAAAVAATVVLAASIGAVFGSFLLNGRAAAGVGPAAGYVTADAVVYVEANLDLPAGQRAALEEFLGRFSGIDVNDVLGEGIAEHVDSLFDESGTDYSYTDDIAPWFNGHVAFAMLDTGTLPFDSMNPLGMSMPDPTAIPGMLAMFGTRDAAATSALLDRVRTDVENEGTTTSSESHAGTTIWSIERAGAAPLNGMPVEQGAYAVTADQLLLAANADTIRTALDVHAGTADSFAKRDDIAAALRQLPDERVATFISDASSTVQAMREGLTELMPELAGVADVYASGTPMLQVGSLRFEGDRVVADGVGSLPSRGMHNSDRSLADAVPADALVYTDGTDIGSYLAEFVAAIKEAAVAAGEEATVAQVEGILGADMEQFLAWIDNAAIAAGSDGAAPWVGLVITPTSVDEAELRLGQLKALAGLAGMAGGDIPLSVTEEQVDGVTVTRFASDALGDEVAFEYAIADGRVLLGFGDTFIARSLATDAASSLASNDRFVDAVEAVDGGTSSAILWADLAAIREAVTAALPAEEQGAFDEEAAPWLDPLDTLVGVMRVENEHVISRGALIAK